MNITIISVGKIKEKYLSDAIIEYSKRISRYSKLDIIEVADEKTPENPSDVEKSKILEKESERILKYLKKDAFLITLEILGNELTSENFAKKINELSISGKSDITFIIGGSLGLSKNISELSDFKLSFSKMTFPHQLMRVILLEQVYRCFRIINGEPYHK
ncbi:23S rRNA (pseudouridine(1915)-N(3))-methyltransferase RlmH [Methanococcus sp. CF]